jgi:aspartate aminotransferase
MSTAAEIPLSRLVQSIEPSATIAMGNLAKQLKAKGVAIHDFSLGEPDFTTPQHICDAAVAAMQAGHTHYTPSAGIPKLREAVAKSYSERHGIPVTASMVVVSNGAKHAISNVLETVLNPGDEVLIPAPYWVSYSELVKITGAVPVVIQTRLEDGFKLSSEQLREHVTDRSRMFLFCSPSNPTGTTYSAEELGALADVCLEHDLLILSDEIYEHLVYDGQPFTSFPTVRDGLMDRTLLINGVSKTYAMTGWRIGWSITPQAVAKGCETLQGQQTSNPSSVSQYAALAAITGPQDCVADMKKHFALRREYVRKRLGEIDGIDVPPMDGAFYAFFGFGSLLNRKYNGVTVNNSTDWSLQLLDQQGVATVPGLAFGTDGFARMSYACDMATLEAGLDGIARFVASAE